MKFRQGQFPSRKVGQFILALKLYSHSDVCKALDVDEDEALEHLEDMPGGIVSPEDLHKIH